MNLNINKTHLMAMLIVLIIGIFTIFAIFAAFMVLEMHLIKDELQILKKLLSSYMGSYL